MLRTSLGALAIGLLACKHASLPAAAADSAPEPEPAALDRLVATIVGTPDHPDLRGEVHLVRTPGGVQVSAEFTGVPPGPHGWHVHEYGDCSDPVSSSMGSHLDFAALGGDPPNTGIITGDLGPLEADERGYASESGTVAVLEAEDLGYLNGRAVVVHAGPNDPTQPPAGAAGPAIACGVLGLAPPEEEAASAWPASPTPWGATAPAVGAGEGRRGRYRD